MQAVNEINADYGIEMNHSADVRASKHNLIDLFAAEFDHLKRIVTGMGLNASDSEDVLQDVSIKAMRETSVFETRADSVRWLIKVTVNNCLMEHRRRRSFSRNAREILERRHGNEKASKATDEKIMAAEELEIVREILRELDDSLLAPIVLCYFCGLNSKDAGQALALSPSTVRGRLREARMTLANRLLERGVEP